MRVAIRCVAIVLWCTAAPVRAQTGRDALTPAQFGALSARLSDAGGAFDTDNLISNEKSLLHPLSVLDRAGVRGGVYIGVGPDQNFNYIARVRPRLAIIADIRRDNLLHHLLFKALFTAADSRQEFLALWTGRPMPTTPVPATIDAMVAWVTRTPVTAASRSAALRIVREQVLASGVALSSADLATIARFHTAFIADGVGLRFTSTGRAPQWYYPTLGQLLTERDREGRQASYLASDSAYRAVQSLERRNLVVPVVGDLSGPVLDRIASVLRERGDSVSVLYTSNVEDYLIRDGRFADFVRRVRALPRQSNAMVIRSWFGGEGSHPLNVAGYHTTQLTSSLAELVNDASVERVRRYWELVGRVR